MIAGLLLSPFLLLHAGEAPAAPVVQELALRFSVPASLVVGSRYSFDFRLYDTDDTSSPAAPLWEESRRYRIPGTRRITHRLGSVVPFTDAVPPVDFGRQLWVEVRRGARLIGGRRIQLGPVVPYALHSESVVVGGIGTEAILDGSVGVVDLQDGAALGEILDDDGSGSGLDADLLDGQHADSFAASGHAHDAAYVNEGQTDSIASPMIVDGTITDADIATAAAIADAKLATIVTPGKVAAAALPASVMQTDTAQTVTGLKTFQAGGGVPFAVDPANGGMVANLYAARAGAADTATAAVSALDAAALEGRTLADLDARYGIAAPSPSGATRGYLASAVSIAGDWGTSIAIGADNLPIVAYPSDTTADLKILHCSNAACTDIAHNATTAADSAGYFLGHHASITIGADGLPVVSYSDTASGVLKVLRCGDVACSGGIPGNTTTTVDASGDVGYRTSIAIGVDGFPIVSYQDVTNGDLRILHCGTAACTDPGGNTTTTVDAAGIAGYVSSITIGADGLPVVSYTYTEAGGTATDYDLKILHCGNAGCTDPGGNTTTTVDSAGSVGYDASTTIGADGFPVVSYQDVTNGDLRILHCSNAACTDIAANTTTTVDSAGDVGSSSSITIGADGLPLVSYYDQTRADLKVLHCGNAGCTDPAGNTITTADSGGGVGSGTAITIGADGLPVISYHDFTNGQLKIAKGFVRPLGRR